GPGEYAQGSIEGSEHIPLAQLRDRLGELDRARPVVVFCAGGYRSSIAASLLRASGFADVSDLIGGYPAGAPAAAAPYRWRRYRRRRSEALATLATITAKGGIATATAATTIAASEEYRSITAQDSTNRPMQVAISPKYQRRSVRVGCGPGSVSWPITG